MKQNNQKQTASLKQKIFFVIALIIIIPTAYFMITQAVWQANINRENHVEKPFVDGTKFLIRYYNSGCFYMEADGCHFTKYIDYYYITDLEPEDLMKKLPGWRVVDDHYKGQDYYPLGITKEDPRDLQYIFFMKDKEKQKRFSNIGVEDNSTKYLISLRSESYEALMGNR